ncbi:rad4 beta-hairpin domain 1-containing protein [Nitzschia inconspicua]|uniref:Rad4 beta-hairpin domain 1-containing protein n=1 Tax=Nitzschia inconspicua TaxID=303405 RepID=A0A9K3M210_9STRA|nr:rad4 beta-hairpin domain 1-containing protein [Nitzschia inconspicua]
MSLDWNLSPDEEEDDFEHWAQGQHEQLLSTAALIHKNTTTSRGDEDDEDEDNLMDCKPPATENGVPLDSDFYRLSQQQQHHDDSDDDQIDWEDAEGDDDEPNLPNAKLPAEAVTINLSEKTTVNGDVKTKSRPKRAKKVFRYNHLPPDLQQFLHLIRNVHMMCWASHGIHASAYASQEEQLHVAHSVLPKAWAIPSTPTTTTTTTAAAAVVLAPTVEDVHHFVRWFEDFSAGGVTSTNAVTANAGTRGGRSMRKRHAKDKPTSRKSSTKRKHSAMEDAVAFHSDKTIHYRITQHCSDLSQATNSATFYNEYDNLLLFLSMARSMSWRARYVVAVEPIPQDLDVNHPLFQVMTNRNILLGFWNVANKRQKAAANPIDLTTTSDDQDNDTTTKNSTAVKEANDAISKPLCWIEVLCQSPVSKGIANKAKMASKSGLQWIHVDPVLGVVNHPAMIEQLLYAYHQHKPRSSFNTPKRNPIPYAIAVEHMSVVQTKLLHDQSSSSSSSILRMTDVTPRYAYSMVESLQARGLGQEKQPENAKNDWFSTFLRRHSHHATTKSGKRPSGTGVTTKDLSSTGKTAQDAITIDGCSGAERSDTNKNIVTPEPQAGPSGINHLHPCHMEHEEEKQLDTMRKREPLPTSKAAFKKHPTYVIASCLNSTEVLVPDAKKRSCGIFKGELVYLRCDVETALPEKKWLYKGRKVRDEELKQPILKVKARKKTSTSQFKALKTYGVGSSNDGSEEAIERQIHDASQPLGDGKLHLFASWQTDPWSPPMVQPTDPIPTNDYGNIELELLNPGLVHIDLRGVAKTAKKLSIPYKPCLIGFEGHGGNRTPTIRGIVVHAHNETLLRDAHIEVSHHLKQQEEENKKNTILRNWKRLLVGVLTKDRLERTYGNGEDDG